MPKPSTARKPSSHQMFGENAEAIAPTARMRTSKP
jgi:hypothetical protein